MAHLVKLHHGNKIIIGNSASFFFCVPSDHLLDFLQLRESGVSDEDIKNVLLEKYGDKNTEDFYSRLEIYCERLLRDNSSFHDLLSYKGSVSVLTLNVTRACNLKCTYCFESSDFRAHNGKMSMETAVKAVELFLKQIDDSQRNKIIFTGGEPLLNLKVIKEVVAHIKKKAPAMLLLIKTNATLINHETAAYIMDNGINLQISIDGTKDIHDLHRKFSNGDGTFNRVKDVLDYFIECGYGNRITLVGTATHQTVRNIASSLKMLRELDSVASYTIHSTMESNNTAFDFTDEDHIIYTLSKMMDQYLRGNSAISKKCQSLCGIGKWHVSVDVDGLVYPCYRLSGIKDYILGDINVLSKLSFLNTPEKLQGIYEKYASNVCQNCISYLSCTNNCYAEQLLVKEQCQKQKNISKALMRVVLFDETTYSQLPVI